MYTSYKNKHNGESVVCCNNVLGILLLRRLYIIRFNGKKSCVSLHVHLMLTVMVVNFKKTLSVFHIFCALTLS